MSAAFSQFNNKSAFHAGRTMSLELLAPALIV
jgi:hypothetical protein